MMSLIPRQRRLLLALTSRFVWFPGLMVGRSDAYSDGRMQSKNLSVRGKPYRLTLFDTVSYLI
jgi:hypothetical protein